MHKWYMLVYYIYRVLFEGYPTCPFEWFNRFICMPFYSMSYTCHIYICEIHQAHQSENSKWISTHPQSPVTWSSRPLNQEHQACPSIPYSHICKFQMSQVAVRSAPPIAAMNAASAPASQTWNRANKRSKQCCNHANKTFVLWWHHESHQEKWLKARTLWTKKAKAVL